MRGWLAIGALVALFSPSAAQAAGIALSASLSEARIYTGEVVTLEIVAVSSVEGNVEIEVPPVDGLDELRRGHSDSTSISWINGAQTMRRERILRIDYEAKKAGVITIPPIEGRIGSEKAVTAPLTLEVSGEDLAVAAGPGEAPTPGEVAPPTREEGELFVRYRTDKARAFLGEQILVDLEIFTAANFNLEETRPPPTLDGFWREILEQATRLEPRVERVAGKTYRVYRLWRLAIFGLEAGERTIPPVQLSFSSNRSMFSSGQRVRRSTPPIMLEILPLPSEGRPKELITTNVGRYALTAQTDATHVVAGKGVMLSLILSGAGNISAARLPEVREVDGFRVFPPTLSENIARQPNGIAGNKRADILLVPQRGGRLEIPAFTLPVFDPVKRDYELLRTDAIPIYVEGDPQGDQAAPPPPAPSAPERAEAGDLRPLRFRSALTGGTPSLAGRPYYFGLLAIPPLLFLLALGLQASLQKLRTETPSGRRKRVLAEARSRLAAAERALATGTPGPAFTEVNEVLLSYATLRTGIGLRGLTSDEARAALEAKGAPPKLVDDLVAELKRCEFARFAPGGGQASEARAALERARSLLIELDAWAQGVQGEAR